MEGGLVTRACVVGPGRLVEKLNEKFASAGGGKGALHRIMILMYTELHHHPSPHAPHRQYTHPRLHAADATVDCELVLVLRAGAAQVRAARGCEVLWPAIFQAVP
jgi:hypothetical protein